MSDDSRPHRVGGRGEIKRLRLAYAGLAAAVRELTGMPSPGLAAEATGVVTPAQRAAIDATEAITHFCVWCQGGPANDWRYETLIEPDDTITLAPVPGREGEFIRVLNLVPGDEPWPDAVTYIRVRNVEQIDGECIYYPEGDVTTT